VKEPPSLDGLAHYEVRIEGEDVIVRVPEPFEGKKSHGISKFEPEIDGRIFVIIGTGAAGNAAAQTLREDGFKGRIIMITQENQSPYDRPQLSKQYMEGQSDAEGVLLRPGDFYKEHAIELKLQSKVIGVDTTNKSVSFNNGETINYDKLLISSGGIARNSNVRGADLENIFTLRSFEDAERIFEASKKASHIVIVGSSFIAMETANALRERNRSVTVVTREAVPFGAVLGPELGKIFQMLHERKGVNFKFQAELDRFEGAGKVQAVVLNTGERISSDMVILGIGVIPATEFLRDTGLVLADGSIRVDDHFEAGADIYAAGDVATFREWRTGEEMRIEHWRTAEQQGRIAGHNMAGKKIAYRSVPFFWTNQVGLFFRYVGHAKKWDEIIVHGNLSDLDFIVFYAKNNQIYAAAGNNRDREIAAIEELMRLNKMPSPDEIRNKSLNFVELLKNWNSRLGQAA